MRRTAPSPATISPNSGRGGCVLTVDAVRMTHWRHRWVRQRPERARVRLCSTRPARTPGSSLGGSPVHSPGTASIDRREPASRPWGEKRARLQVEAGPTADRPGRPRSPYGPVSPRARSPRSPASSRSSGEPSTSGRRHQRDDRARPGRRRGRGWRSACCRPVTGPTRSGCASGCVTDHVFELSLGPDAESSGPPPIWAPSRPGPQASSVRPGRTSLQLSWPWTCRRAGWCPGAPVPSTGRSIQPA